MSDRTANIVRNTSTAVMGPIVMVTYTVTIVLIVLHSKIEPLLYPTIGFIPAYMVTVYATMIAWTGFITFVSIDIIWHRLDATREYYTSTQRFAQMLGTFALYMTIGIALVYMASSLYGQLHMLMPSFGGHLVRD